MGFTLLRRCQHPGCDAVLQVAQVTGSRVEVLHTWRGDQLEVQQCPQQPYPEEPRYCAEHEPGRILQVPSTPPRPRRKRTRA